MPKASSGSAVTIGPFTLGAQRIAVEINNIECDRHQLHGVWSPDQNKIVLTDRPTRDKMEQVFLHEVVHAICSFMGRKQLGDEEAFVDLFATLLHQVLATIEPAQAKS